jgi:hypothetical protein
VEVHRLFIQLAAESGISMTIDDATLRAALAGYLARHAELTAKMDAIRKLLRDGASAPPLEARPPKQRTFSAAARQRIAAAQRKRWKAFRAKAKTKKRTQH